MIARVHKTVKRLTRRRQSMVTVTLSDGTGTLDLTFFNQPWAAGHLQGGSGARGLGHRHPVSGPAPARRTRRRRSSAATSATSCTRGGSRRSTGPPRASRPGRSASWCSRALERLPTDRRTRCPSELLDAEGLEDLDTALRRVHFPEDAEQLARAIERLKFDELFTLELGVAFRKHRLESERTGVAHGRRASSPTRLLATAAVRADEGADARDRGGRRGDGGRTPDERPPAGRRRLREDRSWRSTACLVGDPVGPSGRDHGAHRGPGRAARALGRGAPRGRRLRSTSSIAARPAPAAPHGQGSLLEELPTRRTPEPEGDRSRTRSSRPPSPGRTGPASSPGIADGQRGPRDRDPRARAGGGVVPRPLPRRRRRAASVRPAPADGAQGQGRRRDRRADHDGDADPADAGAHVLRRPRRRRARRDAEGPPADRDGGGALRRGARRRLRPRPARGRRRTAGVRGVRRDRRGEPLAGAGGRGRGASGSPRRSSPISASSSCTDGCGRRTRTA